MVYSYSAQRPTLNELLQLLLSSEVARVATLLLAAVVGSWVEPGVAPGGGARAGQAQLTQSSLDVATDVCAHHQ